MQRREHRWRVCAALLLGVSLTAPPAHAQILSGYRIEANGCGFGPTSVSTTELFVSREGVTVNNETGSYAQCLSSAGGDSGVLTASAILDRSGGTVANLPVTSFGSFREQIWIDDLGPGQTATIEASLALGGAADVGGAVGTARVSGTLNVNGCRITRTIRFDGEVTTTPNCYTGAEAIGDAGGLFVSVPISESQLGPPPLGNYIVIQASVGTEVSFLNVPGVAIADVTGELRVSTSSTSSATFSFSNPGSFTAVPEPAETALGLAALGTLAGIRKRHALRRG